MFNVSEQLSAATKANIESQIAILTTLTSKAFEGVEKIVDLNLNVAKASIEESTANVKQLLAARDAQDFLALSATQAQPSVEKALAYGRHLASIASSTQAEFAKATEAQIAETSRKLVALIDEIAKNAPAGSENAVALLKSAIGNANASYEQIAKSAKQAVETLETNLNTAVNQFTQAAVKAGGKASRKAA